MPTVIDHYALPQEKGEHIIEVPFGAIFRHFTARSDDGTFRLFFERSNIMSNISNPRFFQVFATGEEVPNGLEYLQTYAVGPFAFHLYERKQATKEMN